MELTERFEDALVFARRLHRGQIRKGSGVPYFSHLMMVSGLVLDHGGDEDEAVAALLHDAVEDQGGESTLADIRRRFGSRVALIVAECSDSRGEPKPPWEERKKNYLAAIPVKAPSSRLVSAADKYHNAQALLEDYRIMGEDIWRRFNPNRSEILWYYGSLVRAFKGVLERSGGDLDERPGFPGLVGRLDRVVGELLQEVEALGV